MVNEEGNGYMKKYLKPAIGALLVIGVILLADATLNWIEPISPVGDKLTKVLDYIIVHRVIMIYSVAFGLSLIVMRLMTQGQSKKNKTKCYLVIGLVFFVLAIIFYCTELVGNGVLTKRVNNMMVMMGIIMMVSSPMHRMR
jgi:hypothetical protein